VKTACGFFWVPIVNPTKAAKIENVNSGNSNDFLRDFALEIDAGIIYPQSNCEYQESG
jgi:hypothetical protein